MSVVAPLRCWRCTLKLAEKAGPGTVIACPRCHATNQAPVAK